MSSQRAKRINKELRDLKSDPTATVQIEVIRDDINNLKGSFLGPPDTPYEGGNFVVEIKIPSEYPFRPPKMKFETRIWHPNVSSVTGAICLDTLSSNWSPVLTVKSALIMLQSLLSSPEPKDPQDAEVASMMLKSPKEFEHKAREWAIKFASAPRKEEGEGSGGATPQSLRKSKEQSKEKDSKPDIAQYRGYHKDLVDRFCAMGFEVQQVVAAFEYVGIDQNDGQDYELEEAYMGDITARLFNEP